MIKRTIIAMCAIFVGCKGNTQEKGSPKAKSAKIENTDASFEVSKSEAEWQKVLTPAEFYVLRKEGTENPFSSDLLNNKQKGDYVCAACGTKLFESKYKFDSGTGWPSFDREIKGNVAYDVDDKLGYKRTEEHCATCGGHLGHVFDDGPSKTTGKRHCINGVALHFVPEQK